MMMESTPEPEKSSTTLRGYRKALQTAEDLQALIVERDVSPGASKADKPSKTTGVVRARRKTTRPIWASSGAVRPSSVAARNALSDVTNSSSKIDQQLAIVEMLFAVGPDVRDDGALEEALDELKRLEDELAADLARFLRASSDVRADGAGFGQPLP
jgi:hypothetical protein